MQSVYEKTQIILLERSLERARMIYLSSLHVLQESFTRVKKDVTYRRYCSEKECSQERMRGLFDTKVVSIRYDAAPQSTMNAISVSRRKKRVLCFSLTEHILRAVLPWKLLQQWRSGCSVGCLPSWTNFLFGGNCGSHVASSQPLAFSHEA